MTVYRVCSNLDFGVGFSFILSFFLNFFSLVLWLGSYVMWLGFTHFCNWMCFIGLSVENFFNNIFYYSFKFKVEWHEIKT